MNQITKAILMMGLVLSSISASAGICEMTIDRKACPGQEEKALAPYKDKGGNPTVEKKPAGDLAECKKKADEASKIIRKGTLTSKTVTAKFGAEDAGTYSDKASCN